MGTTCSYRIRAEFDDGATITPWSPWLTETPFGSAPTLNGVDYSNDGASLFFTAPTLSSGLTVTSYDYEISQDGGSSVYYGPVSTNNYPTYGGNTGATSSPFTDPIALSYCQVGTTCSYRIRAEVGNSSFQSPWSPWVAETPFGSSPTLNSVNYSNDGASLFFTAPTLSPGLTVTSYDYEISQDGGSSVYYGPVSTNNYPTYGGNTGATSSPFTDPIALSYCQVGTTCSYRIRAEVGNLSFQSPWSPWVAETPFGSSPTLNSVNYSNDGASLFFTAPTLSPGLTVTSYDYEISQDGGSSVYYGPISTNSYPAYGGNTGPTSSPFTDPNALSYCQVGTTCSYRIRAEVGNSSFQSPWSPWVTMGIPASLTASPSSGAAPLATALTLSASDPSGRPLTYSLSFGDGSSTTGSIPSPYAPVTVDHTYATAGTFTAGVTFTDASVRLGQAVTTVSATGTVPLTADAGGSQTVTSGQSVTFDGTGSRPSASITSYRWDFGDGSLGSGQTAQHAYPTAGTRTVTLTVGTASGQYATSQVQVTVVAPPATGQGLSVTVTDGTNPLAGVSLAVVTADGTRFPATTDGSGVGVVAGLPDGVVHGLCLRAGLPPRVRRCDPDRGGRFGHSRAPAGRGVPDVRHVDPPRLPADPGTRHRSQRPGQPERLPVRHPPGLPGRPARHRRRGVR